MVSKPLIFLRFLRITAYLLFVVNIAFVLGMKYFDTKARKKYIRMLSTIYTLGVGLVLLCFRFPFIVDLRGKVCITDLSHIMFSAGLIVLSTINVSDVDELIGFFRPNVK